MNKYKKFHTLSEEFESYLKDLQGLFIDSLLGYQLICDKIKRNKNFLKQSVDPIGTTEIKMDDLIFGHENLSRKFMPSGGLFFHKNIEVENRNRVGGQNGSLVVKLIVVTLFSYWEHYFRSKVSDAYGVKRYFHNFWGDLRLLRNVLVHPCKENLKKLQREHTNAICEIYANGLKDLPRADLMRKVFLGAYCFKNELFEQSLPKSKLRIG